MRVPATPAQRALARELAAQLDSAPLSARPLKDVVAQLPGLLQADQGCAFLVRVDNGTRSLEFFHGHGYADIASKTPITEDTVFHICSIRWD